MDLRRLREILRRRALLVVLAAACAVGAAWGTWTLLPATYEAKALLNLTTAPIAPDWRQYDLDLADRLINSYIALAESRRVGTVVASAIGSADPPYLSLEAIPNSNLLEAVARAESAEDAATAANVLSVALASIGAEIELEGAEIGATHSLFVVEEAAAPENPRGIPLPLLLAIAMVVGLLLGLFLALVAENLDKRIYFADDAANVAGMPVLAIVSKARGFHLRQLAPGNSPAGRAYRRLCAQLKARSPGSNPNVVLAVSDQSGANVPAVTANLADALAAFGKSVLIVDTVPRTAVRWSMIRPSGPAEDAPPAVTEAVGTNAVKNTQVKRVKHLTISAAKLTTLMQVLATNFDTVLIDAGSLSADDAALYLAAQGIPTLLVVRLGGTDPELLADARHQLSAVGSAVLGAVLTDARSGSTGAELVPNEALHPPVAGMAITSTTSAGHKSATSRLTHRSESAWSAPMAPESES